MKNDDQIKVLLVNPPSDFKTPVLPLGLATIAACLKENNVNVSVIDGWAENLKFDELKKKVAQSNADLIGVYMVSPRYDKAKATIEVCKKALPKSIIVAGGPHPSAVPAETLNEIPALDVCVIGEGEITLNELVKAIKNGIDLSTINGLAFRDKNISGEIILTQKRDFVKNLDELPYPARELFPLEKYTPPGPYGMKKPYFTIITSRGCPRQCAYCSKDVFKDNYRARSPKNVCGEIEWLINKYRAREIHFADDDFSMDIGRAEAICDEIIKRGLKFRWSTSTRVDQVNEQLLKKMKQAGCWLIIYGVESGNQQVLNGINKGIRIEQVIKSFEMARKAGLATMSGFIVGLPGETRETIQDTANLIKKIKPNFLSIGILTVFPGSRLFKLIQSGKYPGRLRTIKEEEGLPGIFYKGTYVVFEDNLSFEEQKKAIKKIQQEFYLRPQYIIQCFKSIRSISDFIYYLNGGLALIKALLR